MPRISYVPMDAMDEEMRTEMERCAREGTPRPESSAIRAHAPEVFKTFTPYWHATFREGELDHATKELCRLYITRTTNCQFCGNQRSSTAALMARPIRSAARAAPAAGEATTSIAGPVMVPSLAVWRVTPHPSAAR